MDYFFTENQAPTMDLEDARKRSNRVGLAFFVLKYYHISTFYYYNIRM